ncbi:glycosyltransferase family 2 protein [Thalassovita sp.]|jgi:hypothetical protein|uniref:glycosyltransferase family 2 protein n=1 Tax=Thalassovita sp. TaxID=1979401 RepID=UPI003B5CE12F
MPRILAILSVRNEGSFLLEWLAHHQACGFTDFLVFSNDCQDGTDTMLDRLQGLGLLTHIRNPGPHDKQGIQFTAMRLAAQAELTRQADWILPLDVDEFVNIHVGDRTVSALVKALPDATAITLTWRLFGNAGVVLYADRPVTQQFTRAAPRVIHWPWRAVMFKTLYRNDGTYGRPGVHRPADPDPTRLAQTRWFDTEGRELGEAFQTSRIFSDYRQEHYGLAQLNHYPLGAMESYLVKADRGRAVHSDDQLGMDYWTERNYCTDEDTSITAMADRMRENLAALKKDEQLAQLHRTAVEWRRARIQNLLEQEPYRALMTRMMLTPPARPIPAQAARYLAHHAARAHDGAASSRRKP